MEVSGITIWTGHATTTSYLLSHTEADRGYWFCCRLGSDGELGTLLLESTRTTSWQSPSLLGKDSHDS